MNAGSVQAESPLRGLLSGEPATIAPWTARWESARIGFCLAAILLGAGCYGAAMGFWRSPQQAWFVALKFPLIILLTAIGNGLLNAMLAPLLGLSLSLRQSFMAILMSFAIASAILGSFSPVVAFLVWNAPPMGTGPASQQAYVIIQLTHVVVIAFAGITANLRLAQLLRYFSAGPGAARRVLCAWLLGNLFFGSQLSWILRPFIGSPGLPVEFLRPDAFHGNFYETVLNSLLHLLD
jgi:hypothetical protein